MKKVALKKFIIFPIFLFSILLSVPTMAATPSDGIEPQASSFLTSYSVGIHPVGNGKVEVSFSVVGTDIMDRIGAAKIVVYESTNNSSWSPVKTYNYTTYSNLTATNRSTYGSDVTYSGTSGRYYKAIVTIYAAKDGGSDSRLVTTSSVKAKT